MGVCISLLVVFWVQKTIQIVGAKSCRTASEQVDRVVHPLGTSTCSTTRPYCTVSRTLIPVPRIPKHVDHVLCRNAGFSTPWRNGGGLISAHCRTARGLASPSRLNLASLPVSRLGAQTIIAIRSRINHPFFCCICRADPSGASFMTIFT